MHPLISIMLPTRGRPELCRLAVASLCDRATHPDAIEIVLRRDLDDAAIYEPFPRSTVAIGPSLGYAGLHEYYNTCARVGHGEWLAIWNDDAEMLTDAWDDRLRERERDPIAILHSHFPVLSRRWFQITGRIAHSPHVDSYATEIAAILHGRGVISDRAASCGAAWSILHKCDAIDDEGSARRRAEILGPEGTSAMFFKPAMRAEIELDAAKLAQAFGALGASP